MQSRSQELTASQLLEACENIYATFNFAGGVPPGTHLEEKLVALGANEDEKCFITEVVYGMMRFRKFLSSFLESFYHHNRYVLHSTAHHAEEQHAMLNHLHLLETTPCSGLYQYGGAGSVAQSSAGAITFACHATSHASSRRLLHGGYSTDAQQQQMPSHCKLAQELLF